MNLAGFVCAKMRARNCCVGFALILSLVSVVLSGAGLIGVQSTCQDSFKYIIAVSRAVG